MGYELWAMGYGLWAMGYGLLAIGYWLLAIGVATKNTRVPENRKQPALLTPA
jgi:hypothetical protein